MTITLCCSLLLSASFTFEVRADKASSMIQAWTCKCLSTYTVSFATGATSLPARSLLGVWLELGPHLPLLELLCEALIVGPEQADVWNVKQHHCQPLQA